MSARGATTTARDGGSVDVAGAVIDHLDLWTGAVTKKSSSGRGSNGKVELTGIKKLRELVLELAVRGKLVDQSQEDEPSSELLKKIVAEKTKRIESGVIKKPKQLPAIDESELPFQIPTSWKFIRLGDAVDIIRGITFPASEKSRSPAAGRLACLRTTNVQDTIEVHDLLYIKESFVTKNSQYIQKNDIVMSMANSRELVGKVAFVEEQPDEPMTFGGFLGVLRPTLIHPKFLMAVLRAPHSRKALIGNASQTTNIANISIGKLNPLVIGLPPIEEQHRIVQKVDDLMALCDRLEQQTSDQLEAHETIVDTLLGTLIQSENATDLADNWARLAAHFDTLFTTEQSIDKLKQTILQLAVMGRLVEQEARDEPADNLLNYVDAEIGRRVNGGTIKKPKALALFDGRAPYELPKGWRWEKLGRFTLVGTGATPSRGRPDYYSPPEYPWVTSGETSQAFICDTKERVSRLAVEETNISIYPAGTLIVAMYGQGKTRGQISELKVAAGTNQACAAVQPIIEDVSHRRYIKLCFVKLYDEIRENAAGGAQPNLNTGKIANTLIPVPPLAEQHRIVQKVDELMALCDQLKERLNQASETRCQLAEAVVNQAVS